MYRTSAAQHRLTFENSEHHVPVAHPGSVQGDRVPCPHGEGEWEGGDQVEGLGHPLHGQLWGQNRGLLGERGHHQADGVGLLRVREGGVAGDVALQSDGLVL